MPAAVVGPSTYTAASAASSGVDRCATHRPAVPTVTITDQLPVSDPATGTGADVAPDGSVIVTVGVTAEVGSPVDASHVDRSSSHASPTAAMADAADTRRR